MRERVRGYMLQEEGDKRGRERVQECMLQEEGWVQGCMLQGQRGIRKQAEQRKPLV